MTDLSALKARLAKKPTGRELAAAISPVTSELLKSLARLAETAEIEKLDNTGRPVKTARKTHTIRLGPIKSESWGELNAHLGFGRKMENEHFEYGEFATIEIELDSSLNIVGGRVVPLAEVNRR